MTARLKVPHYICGEKYRRIVPWIVITGTHACQNPKGHEGPHSWEMLKVQDEEAIAAIRREEEEATANPTESESRRLTASIVGWITDGDLDNFLEVILAAAHERKRSLRGTSTLQDFLKETKEGK